MEKGVVDGLILVLLKTTFVSTFIGIAVKLPLERTCTVQEKLY